MANRKPVKKKGAGGKLSRSEILQARLNPKLRFTVELMARLERRTVSSFIEGLIEKAAKENEKGKVVGERWWPVTEFSGVIHERLREYWPLLNEIASGD